MNVAIIGYGYWGPNLVRNFAANKDCTIKVVSDTRKERLELVKKNYPSVNVEENYLTITEDKSIDVVVIATPVDTHYEIAKNALANGKHIWVEKPFTANSKQAEELIELAKRNILKIFVDHTFIYTGAVIKMKEIIDTGELGDILYFDSVRVNLGLFQRDVNVIWDLAPHDLSIMYNIINKKVKAVAAHGIANYYDHENIANISVYFENNCYAHFHVNWTSPVKIRKMIVGGDKKMLVFDDLENFEKIKIYDAGVSIKNSNEIYSALASYRLGDMFSPKVNQTEALALGVNEFIAAIKEDREAKTNGYSGLQVVKILEAADYSIKNKGIMVEVV